MVLERHTGRNFTNQQVTEYEIVRAISGQPPYYATPILNVLYGATCVDDVELSSRWQIGLKDGAGPSVVKLAPGAACAIEFHDPVINARNIVPKRARQNHEG